MDLKRYFEESEGTGILSTADAQGRVDAALYSKPHFMGDGSVAFIMADRLTHLNLQSNGHAAFLFMEKGPGYKGVRLFLSKLREEDDQDLIDSLSKRKHKEGEAASKKRFLVFFSVDKILPLVGAGESGV